MTPPAGDGASALLALYDAALPQVYGYLLRRCGSREAAEDLTSETFLGAAEAVRRGAARLDVPWLIGIARHKLADHWRGAARDERDLRAVAGTAGGDDPGPGAARHLDALATRRALDELAPQHRAVLTLRYLDDLPVAEVARLLTRTEHATEALLTRAKAAFRTAYRTAGEEEAHG